MMEVYRSTVLKDTFIARITAKGGDKTVYGYFGDEIAARAWALRQRQAYEKPPQKVVN